MDITLSINVSARQLHHPDFVADLAKALKEHAVPANRVRFELPETALMDASEAPDRTVRGLKALGVRVAIDNFGTGYSSLGLVQGFGVSAVKIDRSLVASCGTKRECAAIVQAVSSMTRNLGIEVVAVGVESAEDQRLVASLGCERAQGRFIAEPGDWSTIARLAGTPAAVPAD